MKGDIEIARSTLYNIPVWPVLKPNGSYRLTVDFRNLNKESLQPPSVLPDVEEIANKITQANIDMSDMFLAMSIHPIQENILLSHGKEDNIGLKDFHRDM